MNEELGTNVEMEDSGCVQDDAPMLSISDESVQNINILDLSDDVLLNILKYCPARDLKALGFTCPRLAYLICDHTLWSHVDARSQPCGEDRLQWYMCLLNQGTKHLLVNGYAREAKLQEQARRERAKNPEPSTSEDPRVNAPKRSHDGELKTIDTSNYGNGSAAAQPDNHTESPMSPNSNYPVRLPATYCVRGTSSLQLPKISAYPLSSPSEGTATMTISRSILSRLTEMCPNLTWLSLDYCNIDCDKTRLSMFPATLKKLSLVGSRCYNLPIDKSFLYRIHNYLPHLQEMDVSSCNWLAPSCLLPLSRLTNLDTLRARTCVMLSEFVAYASLATRYGFTKLRVLDVRNSPLADSEVSSLGWLPCLEELYLSAVDEHSTTYEPQEALVDEWELNEPEYFKQRAADAPSARSAPSSPTVSDSDSPQQRTNRSVSYEIFDTLDQERCNVNVFTITVNQPQPRLANVLALLGETERARERFNNRVRLARRRTNQRANASIQQPREGAVNLAKMKAFVDAHRRRNEDANEQERNDADMVENLRRMRENVERMADNLERISRLVDNEMASNDRDDDANHDKSDSHDDESGDQSSKNDSTASNDNSDTSSNNDGEIGAKIMALLKSEQDARSKDVDTTEDTNQIDNSNNVKTEKDEDINQQNDRKRRNHDVKVQIDVKKLKIDDNNDDKNSRLVVNIANYVQNNEFNNSTVSNDLRVTVNNDLMIKISSKNSQPSTSQNKTSASDSDPCTSNSEPSISHSDPCTSNSEPSTSHSDPCTSNSEPSTSHSDPCTSNSESSTSHSDPCTSNSDPCNSNSEPITLHSEPSTYHSEPSTSHSKASSSICERSTSKTKVSTTHNEPSTSNCAPSTSQHEFSASICEPSTSNSGTSTSHNEPSTSHNEPSTSHNEPSTSHNEPSTSHNEPSTSKQKDNRSVKYVKFRRNHAPFLIEDEEEESPPFLEHQPLRLPHARGRAVDEENVVQDGFPFICVDLGRPTPRTYQVTVSNERLNENAPRPRMLNMIRNIFYAPPQVIGPRSLITDMAIRHFGRENNQDIIHIGPNGALIRGGPEANRGRPKKSKLKKLVCTGYNGITNSSLVHLAEAAPEIVFIDFSGTRVNQEGVNSFKLIRPDCEVVYDKDEEEKKDKNDE